MNIRVFYEEVWGENTLVAHKSNTKKLIKEDIHNFPPSKPHQISPPRPQVNVVSKPSVFYEVWRESPVVARKSNKKSIKNTIFRISQQNKPHQMFSS